MMKAYLYRNPTPTLHLESLYGITMYLVMRKEGCGREQRKEKRRTREGMVKHRSTVNKRIG